MTPAACDDGHAAAAAAAAPRLPRATEAAVAGTAGAPAADAGSKAAPWRVQGVPPECSGAARWLRRYRHAKLLTSSHIPLAVQDHTSYLYFPAALSSKTLSRTLKLADSDEIQNQVGAADPTCFVLPSLRVKCAAPGPRGRPALRDNGQVQISAIQAGMAHRCGLLFSSQGPEPGVLVLKTSVLKTSVLSLSLRVGSTRTSVAVQGVEVPRVSEPQLLCEICLHRRLSF
eukprot:SAG31_NODE_8954_length_1357_cov_2.085056_2_plen_229_part_00